MQEDVRRLNVIRPMPNRRKFGSFAVEGTLHNLYLFYAA